jgi:ankyrin repeat protein
VAAEACIAGNEAAVVEAALLLGVSFPVDDEDDEDDFEEIRTFDCNQRDRNGKTALHRAVQQGCLTLLFALLISAGANVNATDNEDDTPLLLACKNGMLEMATMLKDAGAAINVANKGGDTPLLATVAAGNLELVKLLVRAGANVAAKNKDGFAALMLACKEKKEEAAALLMEAAKNAGALDVQDTNMHSALHYASSSGLESIVAKLLSLGADVALKDKWCKPALDVATNDDVKAALRQHGAKHSLFYAAEEGMQELVADPIKEGADVNEQNEAGNTAVERAQNAQTIQVLKGAGATMPEMPEEKKNRLLLDYAEEGLTGGVLMALQAGADVNHKGPNSWTDALAQALLGAGADVNAKDRFGQTPMFCASSRPDNREVDALLRQHSRSPSS